MASLTVVQGGEVGRKYDLEGERWVLGRSPECDVVLDVAAISRRHVILTEENSGFFVQDLGSRNGWQFRVARRACVTVEQFWTGSVFRNFNYLIACPEIGEALAIDSLACRKCISVGRRRG